MSAEDAYLTRQEMEREPNEERIERAYPAVEELRSVLGDLCAAAEKVDDDASPSGVDGKGETLLDIHGSVLAALRAAVVKARQVRGEE